MKQCPYCGKEISYHEMFCSDECEQKNRQFYEMRDRYSKLFAVINGIFVMMIGISIFAYSFLPEYGAYGVAGSLMILSVMYFFLPFPPDVMIHRYKLEKSLKLCRIISLVLMGLGVIVLLLHLFGVI